MNLAVCYEILDTCLADQFRDHIRSIDAPDGAVRHLSQIVSNFLRTDMIGPIASEVLSSSQVSKTMEWFRDEKALISEADENDYLLTNPAILSMAIAELYIFHLQNRIADEIHLPGRADIRMH